MSPASSSDADSLYSSSRLPTSAPSSPPPADGPHNIKMGSTSTFTEQQMLTEEKKARAENTKAEAKRLAARRKRKVNLTPQERARKAKELDELLRKSKIFSDILTQKTKALGRVGRDFDNQALTDAGLELKQQPKIMSGGTMRDYQLEGLTWMYEICLQGLSGILADEMGLGKTIQVISLVALLREQESYFGPHLIIAPLSTLSNWQDEFQKWTPTIPFVLYHGTPQERQQIFREKIMRNYNKGRPTQRFPVVCTSYEMVLRDRASLSKIDWAFIVVDEGHRMKNADAKLFRELQQFKSATRLLITGTPLQNNLKELWSLLHFLMPETFLDWEAFEVWFDFSDLQDEEGTTQFIEDKESQDLVSKIHKVLQPLLLRRIKADVANYLPKKREYVLFAPMTKEQTDLYNVISDKKTDTRSYLENKVVERLTETRNTPNSSRKSSRQSSRAPSATSSKAASPASNNAFAMMMGKKGGSTLKAMPKNMSPPVPQVKTNGKRKVSPTSEVSSPKSSKSSELSTPASSTRGRGRGRSRKSYSTYKVADDSDEDKLDDDAFEAKLAAELAAKDEESDEDLRDEEEIERAATLELAKIQVADKKLGNALMQLRLVCNSPHNFYNPWAYDENIPVDESIVTASGKMLLLDRLLPELFEHGHKVLIFSQFKTQLDILHDYCAGLRKWNVCRIDGGVAQEDRRQQIKEFNEDPDFKIFLLSTRAGGQGINLASADTVILFDSDWNPQQDLQAQDRCHRIGQTRPVIVYRIATKGTVEEELLLSADAKRRLEKLVIKKGGFKTMGQKLDNNETLDKETLQSLLLKDGEIYQHSGGDRILSDEDIDVLCDRSDDAFEKAARGAGNAAGFQVVETAADGITQMKGA
ncbi:SNF2 family N-terminal domain-containing protein [Hypoxylon trugodes]|uniref:SNF2 family N-terminal domain-containing protein n=1 Tax=Hypoxylon trugodes TaxID=326681 RepID=UPI002192D1F3|nr:SNF2 family N-terminal domain-containing protein [Hypoxylon trugodes]KAI1386103.1 SNF2 family N-terminal domain-containing protein [Hypoxylon trugodes]